MTDIYKARYLNALKKAARINRFLKKGYHVFYNGHPQKLGFILKDNWLYLKANETCNIIYFVNDKEWDHGMHTNISDYNKEFNELFEVYLPTAKVAL